MLPHSLFPRHWFVNACCVCLLLAGGRLSQGQPNLYDEPTLPDSAKGYWRLYTDYHSRQTRVSFYSVQHQLLYQEKMNDRYVKLTKRTRAEFDELLTKLVDGHLVADRIKSYELLAPGQWSARPSISLPVIQEPDADSPQHTADQLTVQVTPIRGKKVRLWYLNPVQQPLLISLQDELAQNLYRVIRRAQTDSEVFNLSQLPQGRYRFRIEGSKASVHYSLLIPEGDGPIQLHRLSTQSDP